MKNGDKLSRPTVEIPHNEAKHLSIAHTEREQYFPKDSMWHPWRLVNRRDALSGISWSILQGRRRCRCDVTYLGHLVISEPPFREMRSLAALETSWKPRGSPHSSITRSQCRITVLLDLVSIAPPIRLGEWLNLNFRSSIKETLFSRSWSIPAP